MEIIPGFCLEQETTIGNGKSSDSVNDEDMKKSVEELKKNPQASVHCSFDEKEQMVKCGTVEQKPSTP